MNLRIEFHYFYLFCTIVWAAELVTAARFQTIAETKFTFQVLSERYTRSKVQCAVTCALTDGCKAANSAWVATEDAYSCQLLTLATKNSDHLDADADNTYLCEYMHTATFIK